MADGSISAQACLVCLDEMENVDETIELISGCLEKLKSSTHSDETVSSLTKDLQYQQGIMLVFQQLQKEMGMELETEMAIDTWKTLKLESETNLKSVLIAILKALQFRIALKVVAITTITISTTIAITITIAIAIAIVILIPYTNLSHCHRHHYTQHCILLQLYHMFVSSGRWRWPAEEDVESWMVLHCKASSMAAKLHDNATSTDRIQTLQTLQNLSANDLSTLWQPVRHTHTHTHTHTH